MSDRLLLTLADKINEIYSQFKSVSTKIISAPRLVLVGTQSSGKSSLINKIIGFELVPIGENMVTRTPVNIRLHNDENFQNPLLTLSIPKDGAVIEVFRILLSDSITQKMELFRNKIVHFTDNITKNKWSISNVPLYIDVYSNKLADFSFVDLPGQVAIACTDKGQSERLTEEIEELIREQVAISNTIVLTVVQSKTDLETDIGLALIKKMQNKYKSFTTVGVITKPDLLDNLDNLNNIVGGNISKNVMLDGGYFVVNNKTESIQKENEYFMQNFDQKREVISNKRYGVSNLIVYLQKFLISSIKKSLPEIKGELTEILKAQRTRAQIVGSELKDIQSKINYFSRVAHQLDSIVINCLESNCTSINIPNVGLKIGKIIHEFVNSIKSLEPFSHDSVDDDYLNQIIESFNGYHLTTQVSMEELVDRCITDKNKKPVMLIAPISIKCVNNIVTVLNETIAQVLKSNIINGLEMYPKLKMLLHNTLTNNIQSYGEMVTTDILYCLKKEEEFLWSTDQEFKNSLNFIPSKSDDQHGTYNSEQVRKLSAHYFTTIKTRVADYIVKLIISGTIKKLEHNVSNDLNHMFITQTPQSMADLFSEDQSIVKERTILSNNILKLEEVINIANTCEI